MGAALSFVIGLVVGTLTWVEAQEMRSHVGAVTLFKEPFRQMLGGNERIGLVAHAASRVDTQTTLDFLLRRHINVKVVFAPEHGFRGTEDAGAYVKNGIDPKTGLPVLSLYGKNKMMPDSFLRDVDMVFFDLQDLGCRFYTYISTLQYVMEACARNRKMLVILDRPNPFLQQVAGPILDTSLRSFVGMQPVPILYGMTIGEYASMLKGEKWVKGADSLQMVVVPCADNFRYSATRDQMTKSLNGIMPSPNLRNDHAIALYPSLCLFEGTPYSVGRGTDWPFEVVLGPYKEFGSDSMKIVAKPGARFSPGYGQVWYGKNLQKETPPVAGFSFKYIVEFYQKSPAKQEFFVPFFDKLTGDKQAKEFIQSGKSADWIDNHYKDRLKPFLKLRSKYLLYGD